MPRKKTKISVTEVNGEIIEKRKTARLDIPIKVQYRLHMDEGEKVATTKNISAGGCLLIAAEEIPVDSNVELEIFLGETESEILRLKGSIVRLNREEDELYEYGISFGDISKDARRLFADFCFAKMYEMIGLPEWPTDRRQKA